MIIVFGDLHLTDRGPRWRTDSDFFDFQMTTLRYVEEFVFPQYVEEGLVVLLPGDIFDHRRESNRVVVGFADWIMRNKDVTFVGLPGQHDLPAKSIENYETHSSLYLAECITEAAHGNFLFRHGGEGVTIPGKCNIRCYGFGETDDVLHNPESDAYKELEADLSCGNLLNIVMAHANVGNEHIEVNGDVRQWGVKKLNVPPSVDYLVLGDIHGGVEVTKIKKGAKTMALGCGVFTWMKRNEVGLNPRIAMIPDDGESCWFVDLPHPTPLNVGWYETEGDEIGEAEMGSIEEVFRAVEKARNTRHLGDEELLEKVAESVQASKKVLNRALEFVKGTK